MAPSANDRADSIYQALIGGIGVEAGRPQWGRASPYLLRHLLEYASDAGRVDELVSDPEFLVHTHPESLAVGLDAVSSHDARLHAAIWRASAAIHLRGTASQRRQLLCLDAARFNATAICAKIAGQYGNGHRFTWVPSWSTGAQVTHALLATLPGSEAIRALAVAEHAGRVVVASGDVNGTLLVRDAMTGQQLCAPVTAHSSAVRALALCDCDSRLVVVSGGSDGYLRWWDVAEARRLADRDADHGGFLTAIAAGEWDSRCVVASAADDAVVHIWDGRDGKLICSAQAGAMVSDLALSDSRLLAALADGNVLRWELDADDGLTHLGTVPDGAKTIELATVDDRQFVIAGDGSGALHAWDLQDGSVVADVCAGSRYPVSWIRSTRRPDARLVAATGNDVGVYDIVSGWAYLPGHEANVVRVAAIPGSNVAVSGGLDGTIRTWTLVPPVDLGRPRPGHRMPIRALATGTVDGQSVTVSCGDTSVLVHRCEDGGVVAQLQLGVAATAVGLGEVDGRAVVAVADTDKNIHLWEPGSHASAGPLLVGHNGWITCLAFSALDGRPVVVSAGYDGTIRTWDVGTGAPAAPVKLTDFGWITALATIDLDGRCAVISGGTDRVLRLWDLTSAVPDADTVAHDGGICAVVAMKNSGTIASASADGSIRQFDVPDLRQHGLPIAEKAGFMCLASGIVDDEPVLAAGDDAGVVRVWSSAAGKQLMAFQFPHPISAIQITDGADLVVGFGRELAVLRPAADPRSTPDGWGSAA